jgi:hypothetical protein
MLTNLILTTKFRAWEKKSASATAGKTMQDEVVEDKEPHNSNDDDDFFLSQIDVDDKTLQIRADFQLAAERLRARAAANNGDNDNINDSRTGEAAEARNVPCNNSHSETQIGRRGGFGVISAEDFERRRARVAKTRRERGAANDDDNDDTDDSRTGEASEARNVPCNDSDSETEIGRRKGFEGISAKDFEPQLEDDNSNTIQPQGRSARKQPLRHPRARLLTQAALGLVSAKSARS